MKKSDVNYVAAVAELYTKRSGNLILPPSDYTLIAEWEKEEIPLALVLRVLDRSFADLDGQIYSLDQFHASIKAEFADWLNPRKEP